MLLLCWIAFNRMGSCVPYSGLLKDRDFLLISNVEVRAVSLEVVT